MPESAFYLEAHSGQETQYFKYIHPIERADVLSVMAQFADTVKKKLGKHAWTRVITVDEYDRLVKEGKLKPEDFTEIGAL